MRFWDSSAVVPLVTKESNTDAVTRLFATDPVIAVAWFTRVEATSALWRHWRAGGDDDVRDAAIQLLDDLKASWIEIDQFHLVAERAIYVLQRHWMKAADALQLASALVAATKSPQLTFVTCDKRLAIAARTEGLAIIEP